MRLLVFTVLIVSTSAMFVGQQPQSGPTQQRTATQPNGIDSMFQGQDPTVIMSIVKRILLLLIRQNPVLMQALMSGQMNMGGMGGGAPQQPQQPSPPQQPAPQPSQPAPVQPLPQPQPQPQPGSFQPNPQPGPGGFPPRPTAPNMAGPGMGAPNMGMPNMGAPNMGAPNMGMPGMGGPPMGAPGMGPRPFYHGGSDKMKDFRLFDLLYDKRSGMPKERGLYHVLPQVMPMQGMPFGWSLGDIHKDHVAHHYGRKFAAARDPRVKAAAREVVGLIGDPIEMMPQFFGPGAGGFGMMPAMGPGAGPGVPMMGMSGGMAAGMAGMNGMPGMGMPGGMPFAG